MLTDGLDRSLRCSKLSIPWGTSSVEVHHGDLFPEPERARLAHLPNMKLSLSAINLPRSVYWKRMVGQFKELYIVSPEGSPNTSPENSQFASSRHPTFKSEGNAAVQPVDPSVPRQEGEVKTEER
jgi:hypothetical protein